MAAPPPPAPDPAAAHAARMQTMHDKRKRRAEEMHAINFGLNDMRVQVTGMSTQLEIGHQNTAAAADRATVGSRLNLQLGINTFISEIGQLKKQIHADIEIENEDSDYWRAKSNQMHKAFDTKVKLMRSEIRAMAHANSPQPMDPVSPGEPLNVDEFTREKSPNLDTFYENQAKSDAHEASERALKIGRVTERWIQELPSRPCSSTGRLGPDHTEYLVPHGDFASMAAVADAANVVNDD
jgi:hypothetical protein